MRAVLTGTDFIKDIDGSFKAIETNTNIGMSVDVTRYLNIQSFTGFVSDNQFSEIVVIYNPVNVQVSNPDTELEPKNEDYISEFGLYDFLKQNYSGSTVTITPQKLSETTVTIPEIEDSENKLIIRISYDTTALIDDTYARDNWEFLKLMYDTDPQSIAKTYINDVDFGFDSIGDVLRDNGNHPNYCIKKRITPTDNNVYPKLLKITTLEQLNNVKSNLESDEYLQEYIYNPSDLLNNKVKVYRSVDMIYGTNLDIMNLWVMEQTAIVDITETPDYDDNNQVQIWDTVRYKTKYNAKTSDVAIKFSADEGTKILDVNNNIVTVQNLNVGDFVKSVSIPNMINDTDTSSTFSWTGDTNTIISGSSVTQTELKSKTEKDYFGLMVEFEIENGSIFSDVPHAKILIESQISGDTVSRFINYNDLNIGDTVLIWDNLNNSIIKQNIINIGYSFQNIKAYTLNVDEFDLFLTLEEGESNRYGLLTHNYNYDCRNIYCGSFPYSLPGGIKICAYGGQTYGNCGAVSICARVYSGAYYLGILTNNCYKFYGNYYTQYYVCGLSGNNIGFGSYCNGQKPSDVDLKEKVRFLYKTKDGLKVYKFTYKESIKKLWNNEMNEDLNGDWQGVMAQELIGTPWESALTKHKKGFYIVDYNKLPKID